MRRHTCNLITIAATMLIMWACGGNDVTYCEFRQLSADGWAYGDTIGFSTTNLTDSIADGHLVVSLRHNNGYPYSNIWLELTRTGNDGTTVRDTVNCVLADLYGRWKGQGFEHHISSPTLFPTLCACCGRLYNRAAHNAHRHH